MSLASWLVCSRQYAQGTWSLPRGGGGGAPRPDLGRVAHGQLHEGCRRNAPSHCMWPRDRGAGGAGGIWGVGGGGAARRDTTRREERGEGRRQWRANSPCGSAHPELGALRRASPPGASHRHTYTHVCCARAACTRVFLQADAGCRMAPSAAPRTAPARKARPAVGRGRARQSHSGQLPGVTVDGWVGCHMPIQPARRHTWPCMPARRHTDDRPAPAHLAHPAAGGGWLTDLGTSSTLRWAPPQ